MQTNYISKSSLWVFSRIYLVPFGFGLIAGLIFQMSIQIVLISVIVAFFLSMRNYYRWMTSGAIYLANNYELKTRPQIHVLKMIEYFNYMSIALAFYLVYKDAVSFGLLPLWNRQLLNVLSIANWLFPVYHCYILSKMLKETETGVKPSLDGHFLESIGFYLSFIGVWFLQPRIRAIFNEVEVSVDIEEESELG